MAPVVCEDSRDLENVSILYPFIQSHVRWAKNSYFDFLDDSKSVFNDAKRGGATSGLKAAYTKIGCL